MKGVMPYLQVKNTGEAIDWYKKVFQAKEVRSRLETPDGVCMNAEIEIEGTPIMLADENPKSGSKSPERLKGTSVVLNLHLPNVDKIFQKALKEGATEIFPLDDQFYGDRAGRVKDPFGHHWILATRIREVPDDEMVAAFRAMFE